MTTAKLNEATLYAAGLDRVTVEALRHIIRQTGDRLGAVTLPQLVAGIVGTIPIEDIGDFLAGLASQAGQLPPSLPPFEPQADMGPAYAPLADANDERPPAAEVAPENEPYTELRALAEEVARLRAELDAIKQGTITL